MRTSWTDLANGAAGDPGALARIFSKYQGYLVPFLIQVFRFNTEKAQEWSHDFVTDRIVYGNILQHALAHMDNQRPEQRKFRTLVRLCCRNWVVDRLRAPQATSLDIGTELPAASEQNTFDEIWCRTLLGETIRAVYDRLAVQRPRIWNVFRAYYLLSPKWPRQRCMELFGLDTPGKVDHAARTGRELFRTLLLERLAHEVLPDEVEESVGDLLRIVARSTDRSFPDLPFAPAGVVGDLSVLAADLNGSLPEPEPALLIQAQATEVLREALELSLSGELGKDHPTTYDTVHDLLHDPSPPLDLLKQLKDYAKVAAFGVSPSLTEEVARWLYFATLAVALARHCVRISSLEISTLREGFSWAGNTQYWPDAPLADVFDQARRTLDGLTT